ncbi:MAG: hypothetical protein ACPG6B_02030, partial [Oceanihabitans sp.]
LRLLTSPKGKNAMKTATINVWHIESQADQDMFLDVLGIEPDIGDVVVGGCTDKGRCKKKLLTPESNENWIELAADYVNSQYSKPKKKGKKATQKKH